MKRLDLPFEHKIISQAHVTSGLWYDESSGLLLDHLNPMTMFRIDVNVMQGSHVRILAALPDKWNGCLVGCGNEGAAGIFHDHVVSYANQGFAAVMTDMGTSGDNPDYTGVDNPGVWIDFGYRATHLMTEAAKALIDSFYLCVPAKSYFIGHSTGGQQALSLAQRYPEDYDGIIAEYPAHARTRLHAYTLWNYQAMCNPDDSLKITEKQDQRYRQVILDYFADRERCEIARHRFITDPRWTAEDQENVLKLAAEKDPSLTDELLNALRKMQQGPVHARTGKAIFYGMPPASFNMSSACWGMHYFNWVFGKNVNWHAINWDKDIDEYFHTLSPILDAENPDLDAFRKRGGKLIMLSGTSDVVIPWNSAQEYYDRVVHRLGSLDKTMSFFRYYILPGRCHGCFGNGVHYLKELPRALFDWCENGVAPEYMTGVHPGNGGFMLNLAPYPRYFSEPPEVILPQQ